MKPTIGTMTPKGLVMGYDRTGRPTYSRTTRLVADDYGTVVMVRRCCECRRWLELGIASFSPSKRDARRRVVRWSARCHQCDAAGAQRRWQAKPPHVRSAIKHAEYERLKADPARMVEERARDRRRQAKRREENPERFRAYVRTYRRKIRQDPKRWAKHLEAQRMGARLRAAKERGVHLDDLRVLGRREERMGRLPVAPLVAAIDEWLNGADDETVGAFLNTRRLRAWRTGQYTSATFDVVDRVLLGIDRFWWEVWSDGDEGYEQAVALFVGEQVAA